jgi:hypothetical protein
MTIVYRVFEREPDGSEYAVSNHKQLTTAKQAAVAAYRKHKRKADAFGRKMQELNDFGVDARESSDDELIEEIGIVNELTNGEFVTH